MAINISNTDSTIYSTDVIERIAELETEFVDATDCDPADSMSEDDWAFGLGEEGAAELVALKALAEEASDYAPDWEYGEPLIHADHFQDYAEELVRDIGGLPQDLPGYIANNIDWEGVAKALLIDYTAVDFGGQTYYVR